MSFPCKSCSKTLYVDKVNGKPVYFEDEGRRVVHNCPNRYKKTTYYNEHTLLTKTITRVSQSESKISQLESTVQQLIKEIQNLRNLM